MLTENMHFLTFSNTKKALEPIAWLFWKKKCDSAKADLVFPLFLKPEAITFHLGSSGCNIAIRG